MQKIIQEENKLTGVKSGKLKYFLFQDSSFSGLSFPLSATNFLQLSPFSLLPQGHTYTQ